ncbi:acyltransferase family protein, partial [Ilumatobacter sp.]|uniref:acyltransferase family protein n=1 Tax=Ilumatobacter sp. TaxID=1967498 RepID=UPI003C321766
IAQRERLGAETLAALANVANWRAATSDASYQELFATEPSPVAHFWSLAIEEQFYLLLPVVAVVALRGGRRWFAAAVGVLLAGSIAATLLTTDFDMLYNGTHTRGAELLIGCMLALVVTDRRVAPSAWSSRRASQQSVRRSQLALGLVGAAGIVGLMATIRLDDAFLVDGGLVLVALLSGALILGVLADGPLAALLSIGPLVVIGRVSYGLYLFHWPIFVMLSPERTGLDGAALAILRLTVVGVVTMLSYMAIEQPIRLRRVLVRPIRSWAVAGGAVAVIALATVLVPGPRRSATDELLAFGDDGVVHFDDPAPVAPGAAAPSSTTSTASSQSIDASATSTTSAAPTTATRRPPAVTILVIGDDPTAADAAQAARPDVVSDVVLLPLSDLEGTASDAGPESDGDDIQAIASRQVTTEHGVESSIDRLGERNVPIVLVWSGPPGPLQSALERMAISRPEVIGLATDADELAEQLDAVAADTVETDDTRERVLVLGDSTSLIVARALHVADERLDVVWAGENGCPIVRAVAIQPSSSTDPKPLDCADFAAKLPPLIADFAPDTVLVVAGPIEAAALVFSDDPTPRVPGDPAWIGHHDTEFAELLTVIADVDGAMPRLLVADAPTIGDGLFSTPEMARDERTEAWNTQIERWAQVHDRVDVFDYATPLAEYEAEHGSVRPDGVHPDVEVLTELARTAYVEQLLSTDR